VSPLSTRLPTPGGYGSVSGAPNLPEGLTDSFTSRFIDACGLRQHAVVEGEGPPLLLVPADDVRSVVIPGAGHWVAEQAPDELLTALTEFLVPYRENGGGLR
jgi:hypothetical protein